jgi:hypothetical protein
MSSEVPGLQEQKEPVPGENDVQPHASQREVPSSFSIQLGVKSFD